MCSDCEAYGLKKHELTRLDYFLKHKIDFPYLPFGAERTCMTCHISCLSTRNTGAGTKREEPSNSEYSSLKN